MLSSNVLFILLLITPYYGNKNNFNTISALRILHHFPYQQRIQFKNVSTQQQQQKQLNNIRYHSSSSSSLYGESNNNKNKNNDDILKPLYPGLKRNQNFLNSFLYGREKREEKKELSDDDDDDDDDDIINSLDITWNGDDMRPMTRIRRKAMRFFKKEKLFLKHKPLLIANVIFYILYELSMKRTATSRRIMKKFLFLYTLRKKIPNTISHRITMMISGLFHCNVLHLLFNMISLVSEIPSWVESGLGYPLTLSTYVMGIFTSNLLYHGILSTKYTKYLLFASSPSGRVLLPKFLLGSSSAIMAIVGLIYVVMSKMGGGYRTEKKRNEIIFNATFYCILSCAFHDKMTYLTGFLQLLGGLLGGLIMGWLFAPGYRKSYSLTRKNSLETDTVSSEYRQIMGGGIVPEEASIFPLRALWISFFCYIISGIMKFNLFPSPRTKYINI